MRVAFGELEAGDVATRWRNLWESLSISTHECVCVCVYVHVNITGGEEWRWM